VRERESESESESESETETETETETVLYSCVVAFHILKIILKCCAIHFKHYTILDCSTYTF